MIYLDSAATTLQKPPRVVQASAYAVGHMASPGRGGHRPAKLAADTAYACRETAARLFRVPSPEQVVLTFNATHGLNIAIKSLVHPGDTVLISGYEHNAVTRPLAAIGGVNVKVADTPLFQPRQMVRKMQAALTPEVSAVIVNHVSNVFGYVLPVEEIAALCRQRGVPLIVDASQSAGCLPVEFDELGAAFIAMPGHKGLYGPQGTGLLLCGSNQAVTLLEGGTGSASRPPQMPEFLPDRLEAGTHNIPGVAGLLAGLRFVEARGTERIVAHERKLAQRAADGLLAIAGVTVWVARRAEDQTGVLSFRIHGQDSEQTAQALAKRGIAVRAGLHCSPLAHQTVGTLDTGTVRASFSAFNTPQETVRFVSAVAATVGSP